MRTKCLRCKEDTLELKVIPMTGEFRDMKLTVYSEAIVCSKCGTHTMSLKQAGNFQKKVSDAYRKQAGLLTADEIRRYRSTFQMNQPDYAEHVGVSSASIKRWELGSVQDFASDRLIRLRSDLQEAKNNYLDLLKILQPKPTSSKNTVGNLTERFIYQFRSEVNELNSQIIRSAYHLTSKELSFIRPGTRKKLGVTWQVHVLPNAPRIPEPESPHVPKTDSFEDEYLHGEMTV